ncbi:Rha family transcriptional regulator [Rhizobium sp. Leaf386]|uniref:Rha family transcriptional regulator n=1 Tax=Rhizobium sp. Leaf386 TaxID=1736359 RepID=UPI0007146DC9|nr:Rha family transcriptional regulator [Rhizobium sp. Leaf386]KQS84149.1 hypothetical protein ASG50_30135 [Rhizobium sp. Leaf386]
MNSLMNTTPPGGGKPETMTSLEIADVVKSRHDSVKRTIERLVEKEVIVQPPTVDVQEPDSLGRIRTAKAYAVNERDSYVVVAQLSPEFTARLVDYWQTHKSQVSTTTTPAEMFLQSAQLLLDIERRQNEQAQRLLGVDDRLKRVEDTAPLKVKPQNTETLSEIRARINHKYGLPPRIVDFVVMKITYKIRPYGMVKNSHEDAQGSSFAVYHIIDVTNLFKRFVSECVSVTATKSTHREIDGPFKLVINHS